MITDQLTGCYSPLWLVISVAEFAVALAYLRRVPWRSDDVRATAAETVLAFAAWYGVHLAHLDFLFDFSLNVAVLVVYVGLSRGVNVRQALCFACTFVLCTELGKVVCVDLLMQPAYALLHPLPSWAVTVVWAVLSLGIALAAALFMGRWVFVPGTERLSWRQCLLSLLPLVPYMYIRSNYFYESVAETPAFYWNFVWMMLILSACTVVMVVGNASNLSAQLERNELIRMQMLLNEQNAQYLAQKEANDAARRRYHDLKHYLAELERLLAEAPRDETAGLIADMRAELRGCEARIETGNEVLDVVLGEKMAACVAVGARPAFYADASCLAFMSAFDLCAVFGNLLDNAVEAVRGLPAAGPGAGEEGQGPEVCLDVRPKRGFVSIRCSNPYVGERKATADGLGFVTTKADGAEHGVGLRSVRATVERYGGALAVETDGGVFTVTAIIPVPGA